MRNHDAPVRTAKTHTLTARPGAGDVGQQCVCCRWGVKWNSCLGRWFGGLIKLDMVLLDDPAVTFLGFYLTDVNTYFHMRTWIWTLTAALLIAESSKHEPSFSGITGKQTAAQAHSSKKEQLRIHWADGRISDHVNQHSQIQVSTYCMIPFTWGSRTDQTNLW